MSGKRLLLVGSVLVLCLACPRARTPSTRVETCGDRPCLQIGSLNVQWLGSKRRHERPLRTEGEVRRIAALLADDLDLEVVVLQEINTSVYGKEEGELVYSQDRYRWLEQALEERGYRLMAGSSGHAQRVVVAYDADEVELLAPARDLDARTQFDFGADCQRAGKRPLAARLRAGSFDFWVVGVHLKSKRDGECSDWIRSAQSDDLVAAIDELVAGSGEGDVVLIGDFNARHGDPSIDALSSAGQFRMLTTPEHRAGSSGTISYLVGQYQSLIDHVMIRPQTDEWVAKSTVVHHPGTGAAREDYLAVISDHAPVWASFYADQDDD